MHLAAELGKDSAHDDGEDVLIIRTLMEYDANVTATTKEVCH